MKKINGGVTSPQGFKAAGIHCGIRKNKSKKDLALIFSEYPATAAAVYTQNLVKGAPLTVTKANLQNGTARAMICNSGNANTCNANGIEIAGQMCALTAKACGIAADEVIVASTGVIGEPLNITPIENGLPELATSLSYDGEAAAEAIMTTDTVKKEIAAEFEINGKRCIIGGIAKGSGMIHPNMATMLVFLTTDVAISAEMLQKAISEDVQDTFNMISVDGDTSTNDMLSIMANGRAGNDEICAEGEDFELFKRALNLVTDDLCRRIAADGEGATKLLECAVRGAATKEDARKIAKAVVCSSLFKSAMFGADANWGRVLCAVGYSGAALDINKVDLDFVSHAGSIALCRNGAGIPFSEEDAKKILSEKEITIIITLADGEESAVARGCDLTYDYVKINGDYRS